MKLLRLAVCSDLHAIGASAPDGVSWLQQAPGSAPGIVESLIETIQQEQVRADYLICCGDLGDKADPDCVRHAWSEVHRISNSLHAREVFATAGNHDVDSRGLLSFDPKWTLHALDPRFPVLDRVAALEFWAQNYTIVRRAGLRLVLLNSAAYHGYTVDKQDPEYMKGRVSDATLTALRRDLSSQVDPDVLSVLAVHHHPMKDNRLLVNDDSEMAGGDRLLNMLSKLPGSRWMVIHGHRHHASLGNYIGGGRAPIVFCASSFSAHLTGRLNGQRNQFYIVEFECERLPDRPSIRGQIDAWSWYPAGGWRRADGPRSGLPGRCGFGANTDVAMLCSSIAGFARPYAPEYVTWDELGRWKPEILYLTPTDTEAVVEELRTCHNAKVELDEMANISKLMVP